MFEILNACTAKPGQNQFAVIDSVPMVWAVATPAPLA
jgi:hypothetical protein